MAKLKSLEHMAEDVGPGDLIRLKLQANPAAEKHMKENTVAVGYSWSDGKLYSASGMGFNQRDTYNEIIKRGVDISEGYYLGAVILGYEVIERYRNKNKQ